MKKVFCLILLMLLCTGSALADGIGVGGSADAVSSATKSVSEKSSLRELQVFTVVVEIDDDVRVFDFETDREYVLEVLLEEGLVQGEQVSWGFNVTTVDGVKADFGRKGEYWSILKYNQDSGDFEPLAGALEDEKVEYWQSYTFVLER